MKAILDLFLHLDDHLKEFTAQAGGWTYLVLFLIVFCETGLVVTPFLPGDSLLFAVGALAAVGDLDIRILAVLLVVAAILGDTANYHIGHYFGPRVLRGEGSRWLNKRHLERTERFFERYGARTIVLARFVPIVRTFAPFVAGIGAMRYPRFLAYNIVGGIIWVTLFLGAGYAFAQNEFVKENFHLVIVGIVGVSVLPMAFEILRAQFARHSTVDEPRRS